MNNLKTAFLSVVLIAQSLQAGPVYAYVTRHPGVAVVAGAAAVAAFVARHNAQANAGNSRHVSATSSSRRSPSPRAAAPVFDKENALAGARQDLARFYQSNKLVELVVGAATGVMGYIISSIGFSGKIVVVGSTSWNDYMVSGALDRTHGYIIAVRHVRSNIVGNFFNNGQPYTYTATEAKALTSGDVRSGALPGQVTEMIKLTIVPFMDNLLDQQQAAQRASRL